MVACCAPTKCAYIVQWHDVSRYVKWSNAEVDVMMICAGGKVMTVMCTGDIEAIVGRHGKSVTTGCYKKV
jgi:cytochrome c oxidase subunit IV